ncbi:XkdF-like putative serine protease domain-containing protein [Haloarcula amylovorans]|uniref:XkdF-like putative serine protease domain-containing protein n=1 Tax=Haloarcula amylovorans TaxID=2562280 RepID=UPI001FD836C7|nr:XkdF-like putative serine protease domain-containing protein [Halomicroarcula amylolytica]
MKQRDEQHYEKRVDYIAKDDDAQTATGVVMVPKTVDHHGDWARPETIETFATQFGAFIDVEEADGGVMHAVWPSEWMALERNEVLSEAEEIGETTVPEGAWVQTWAYNDDELWALVEDDVLGGHSIGAVNVDWEFNGEEPEDLPDDVTVPDEVDVNEYWELTDGIVQEVSAVDFPAVPDAQILSTSKARAATAEKRLADHLGNRSGFLEEAQERGHSEEDAQRMWDVLDRAVSVDGAGEPGTKSKLTSAASAFLNTLTRSDDDSRSEALDGAASASKSGDKTAATVSKEDTVGVDVFRITAAEDDDTNYDGDLLGMGVDFPEHDVYVDWRRDAFPDALDDPHVSIYGSVEDLQQATGNEIESLDSVESPTDGFAAEAQRIRRKAVEETDNYAPDGETSDTDGGTVAAGDSMSNGDNEPPEWAEDLIEQTNKNAERLDEIQNAGDGGNPMDDAPEWAQEVVEQTEKNAERIDAISKQTGATESQQLGGTEKGGDGGEDGELGDRQKFFIPESKRRAAGTGGGR